MNKKQFEQLNRITEPTLIMIVLRGTKYRQMIRYRVLYPNGRCQYVNQLLTAGKEFSLNYYDWLYSLPNGLITHSSCFTRPTLAQTLDGMKEHDRANKYRMYILGGV